MATVAKPRACTRCHTGYLQKAQLLSFMLCIFYHDEKRNVSYEKNLTLYKAGSEGSARAPTSLLPCFLHRLVSPPARAGARIYLMESDSKFTDLIAGTLCHKHNLAQCYKLVQKF